MERQETVIVINNKAGILSLPYSVKGRVRYQDFMPGKNEIAADVLEAVKEAVGEAKWDHYSRHIKIQLEISEEGIELGDLTVNDAKTIIENTMSIEELNSFLDSESEGKNRTGVKKAIEAQIEILEMKKKEEE